MSSVSLPQALQAAFSFERAGMAAAAEGLYRQILAADANQPEVWRRLGLMALTSGRFEEAIPLFTQAIALLPGSAVYYCDLGVAYRRSGQLEKAVESYRAGIACDQNYVGIHVNLGEALSHLQRFGEAIEVYRRILQLNPDDAAIHCDLGVMLAQSGAWEEGIAHFRRAIALDPNLQQALNNLGWALTQVEEYDEAIAILTATRDRYPDLAITRKNLGSAYFRSGHFHEAERCYRDWVALVPEDGTAHRSLGHVLLCFGKFAEGWREFEWRQEDVDFSDEHRRFSVPRWDGQPIPGQTLLIHSEQGFGDTLNFIRYLKIVAERSGAQCILVECASVLVRLMRQSFGAPVEFTIYRQDRDPDAKPFDCYASLISLPYILGMYEPLPMERSYLQLDPEWRAAWRERLGPAGRPRIGIVWAGNPTHVNDSRRSVAAKRFLPLLKNHPGLSFYSLQVDPPEDIQTLRDAGLIDLTDHITDFADSAAFVSELDLIISVDTAVVHLAGALGVPVWTLTPLAPDWRWMLEREDSPWYPSMRLFRQKRAADWDEVFQRVGEALEIEGARLMKKDRASL